MPRSIWSGAISFGLVTVPIHVVGATGGPQHPLPPVPPGGPGEDPDPEGSRASRTGRSAPTRSARVRRADQDADIVPVTDEDLRELPLPTAKAIEIVAFVPLGSVDPIRIGDGYYLQLDGQVAAKPYELLRQALARSSKVAVAKYAWSGRERLGLLRVRDEAIVLHAMRWPDEVRPLLAHPAAGRGGRGGDRRSARADGHDDPRRPGGRRVPGHLHGRRRRPDRGEARARVPPAATRAGGAAGSGAGPDGRAAGVRVPAKESRGDGHAEVH